MRILKHVAKQNGFGFATTALPMVVVTHTGQAASAIANGAAAR